MPLTRLLSCKPLCNGAVVSEALGASLTTALPVRAANKFTGAALANSSLQALHTLSSSGRGKSPRSSTVFVSPVSSLSRGNWGAARFSSATPTPPPPPGGNDAASYMEYIPQHKLDIQPIPQVIKAQRNASQARKFVKIQSIFMGERINIASLVKERFEGFNYSLRHHVAIVQLDSNMQDSPLLNLEKAPVNSESPYVVFYPFGAIVFFNATKQQRDDCVSKAMKYSDLAKFNTLDDYQIVVNPVAAKPFNFEPDCLEMQELTVNSLRVIAQVMAQTVAVDFFEKEVNQLLHTFGELNSELEQNGSLNVQNQDMLKLLGHNNSILTDLITQIKLLDRSETAWKFGKYDELWIGLRDDFEVKERFSALEFKLAHVQHNTKFFLEILAHKKSNKLEWIIIALIAGEIVLSVYQIFLKEHPIDTSKVVLEGMMASPFEAHSLGRWSAE